MAEKKGFNWVTLGQISGAIIGTMVGNGLAINKGLEVGTIENCLMSIGGGTVGAVAGTVIATNKTGIGINAATSAIFAKMVENGGYIGEKSRETSCINKESCYEIW